MALSFQDKIRPVATTTSKQLSFMAKAKPVVKPPVTPPEKKDGFFKSLAKDVAETLVVKPVARATELATRTFAPNSLAAKGYREGGDMNVMGMNIEGQKAFGQGGLKQIVGEGAKTASYLYGGGATANVAKSTIGGKILQGAWQGVKGGTIGGGLYAGGTEIQKDDATVGSVIQQTAIGGAVGGVSGGVLGGALPVIPALIKGVKPEKIMQRVARVNALDQEKFAKTAKESIGEYLVKRGIYGKDDDIVNQLAKRFSESKSVADDAIGKLQGNWKNGAVDDALADLAEREARVSSKNVPSRDLSRVTALTQKHNTKGLTMSEINEVKRLYERNVKLGYLKERNTDMVARSTGIDDAIRTWQFSQADKLGLKNLQEINKETQLARMLGDALLKKNARSGGNNAFGLTDAILISGGDPQAISMLIAKKTFGDKAVQSAIAKKLAPDATVGTPTAIFGKRASNQEIFQSTVIPNGASSFGTLNLGKKPVSTGKTSVSIPVKQARNPSLLIPKEFRLPVGNPNTVNSATVQLRPANTMEKGVPPSPQYYGTQKVLPERAGAIQLPPTQGSTKLLSPQSLSEGKSVSLPDTIPPKAKKSSKGLGTVLPDKLTTEAKKYKSAEEFVKAQANAYHGTPNKEFSEFKFDANSNTQNETRGLGVWVTPQEGAAAQFKDKFVEGFMGMGGGSKDVGGTVMPVHLNLKNPKVYTSTKGMESILDDIKKLESEKPSITRLHFTEDINERQAIIQARKKVEIEIEKLKRQYKRDAFEHFMDDRDQFATYIDKGAKWQDRYIAEGVPETNKKFIEYLKKQGYDGIHIKGTEYDAKGTGSDVIDQIVAFDPKNVQTRSQLTDIWNKANKKP